ncbi:FecR family protein [Flavilitoribacter nigricans]|uniref:Uncharacterized protein n=1 Tax=Flavilitoribacter nigricans (strain ATCC 23147 / DSM 23189 / NBRC 102662 / NCIMB 1420 / SS-2) TaxID=1122177 RepID=A0A2D0ND46_FLAN2|nr:FecR domain-containing protein [Flavilitoribacter nigricans]PHN06099.1 hypothetical protein CRP01_14120 [Flavilitoribacter nigricans DSM 23189 = NBRC 102662]
MNANKYANYSVQDFLEDDDFRRWVMQSQKEDDDFWADFLIQYPEQKDTMASARTLVEGLSQTTLQDGLNPDEKQEMLTRMQARIRRQNEKPNPLRIRHRRQLYRQPLAIAASILLLILAGWWLLSGPATITVTTAYGQRQSITLPDGSQVELNANSTLEYESNWTATEDRRVWLTGEAFFEVEKKTETGQKFQVITEDLTVEVLGTVFNVNSRHQETEVFLEEGSIRLELEGLEEKLLMEPGEMVAYSEHNKQLPAKKQVQAQLHTSWMDNFLFFENAPLRQILEEVKDIYGVGFEVADTSHYSRTMDTAIPIENLDQAIDAIGKTLNLDIRKLGDTYIVE